MKWKSVFILIIFCLFSLQSPAVDIEVPLFSTLEQDIQEFQNKNKPKRVPNIGKNAEPVPEIKIAPDPFPPIQIDATQSVEDSNPPFYDNTNTPSIPSDDVIASENSPSVPERSRESYSQSALLKQDVQVQPRKQTSPQVKRKKEESQSKGNAIFWGRQNSLSDEILIQQQKNNQNTKIIQNQSEVITMEQILNDFSDSYKIDDFDIMGLKLHMTPQDVILIAQENGFSVTNISYSIPLYFTSAYEKICRQKGLYQLRFIHDCVRLQAQENDMYYISELRLVNELTKEQIVVSFVSELTGNQASRIDYVSFGDNSLGTSYKDTAKKIARRDLFWTLVFKKYGQPNFRDMVLWGNPRGVYMKAFMEGTALNGRLILNDTDLPYQDMGKASDINKNEEITHSFSFVKDSL